MSAPVSMRELLEAGIHFGHQTRRWNPKMRRYIWGERAGIYIIDLVQTQKLLEEACNFIGGLTAKGKTVIFVGTKKQAQDSVAEYAEAVGMPYVNYRWLGGLLTNWKTISDRLKHMQELRHQREQGQLDLLGKKERQTRLLQLAKLEQSLGGMAGMERLPDAMVVVDLTNESLAVKEANRLRIPIIGLVDTNCDPDLVQYVVPGNDDAIRSCSLFLRAISDSIATSKQMVTPEQFAAEQDEASTVESQTETVGASA